jgi:hypothetical protein
MSLHGLKSVYPYYCTSFLVINYKFVPFARSKQLAAISSSLQGAEKSILIITEKNGASNEGSAINFIIKEDQLKFEMKGENAVNHGIKVSSKLQEMAVVGA